MGGKVAVVGAGAYVAGPLLRKLQQEGYRTVGIARTSTDLTGHTQFCNEVHQGVLTDFAYMREATAGCTAIINLVNQLNPPCNSIAEQLENNVPVLEACLYAGLHHGVQGIHTSGNFSIPTKGKRGGIDGCELLPQPTVAAFLDHWPHFEHVPEMAAVAGLAEAKYRTDQMLHNFLQSHPRANACIIIPAATYGPGVNGRISFWDKAVQWYQGGHFQDFITGFVHVEDLVASYLAALQRGKPGGRYLVAGEPLRVSDFAKLYCEVAGWKFNEAGPVFANEQGMFYDDSVTRKELQLSWQRTLKESLPQHMTYLREHGKLAAA